ncbi:hypothetical protein CAOG_08981 [Capsaspora owczarzaki ATCC 30864]|uniref:hypothetical protein n=1 Tax=Capsaspora owczarzaki (strain ATCC 30864) TaxID=595528 RepID=UPI000352415C|nr:hypothetical protein CAOG_08981 [Capsaspora owczarzaki ATCC 30864]|eukprot:XP_011270659.1 hypothetical protein CAOG_08981 [Capsaspora owczarzaki ATCC 30864]
MCFLCFVFLWMLRFFSLLSACLSLVFVHGWCLALVFFVLFWWRMVLSLWFCLAYVCFLSLFLCAMECWLGFRSGLAFYMFLRDFWLVQHPTGFSEECLAECDCCFCILNVIAHGNNRRKPMDVGRACCFGEIVFVSHWNWMMEACGDANFKDWKAKRGGGDFAVFAKMTWLGLCVLSGALPCVEGKDFLLSFHPCEDHASSVLWIAGVYKGCWCLNLSLDVGWDENDLWEMERGNGWKIVFTPRLLGLLFVCF